MIDHSSLDQPNIVTVGQDYLDDLWDWQVGERYRLHIAPWGTEFAVSNSVEWLGKSIVVEIASVGEDWAEDITWLASRPPGEGWLPDPETEGLWRRRREGLHPRGGRAQ
jgi:hypothetical protein